MAKVRKQEKMKKIFQRTEKNCWQNVFVGREVTCIVIFKYDELKECVTEDFERFYKMGFNKKQVLPAVMNEYEYGEDFCEIEKICIYLFLALNYAEKKWSYDEIVEKLGILLNGKTANDIKSDFGNAYIKFCTDFNSLIKNNAGISEK